ncbi:MAG TPA: DinB family protein [Candidatus Limnocylindrales bacterium]|nr:DinB family protein [Candidatus Limnocylindrales bacterium]
MTTSLLAEGFGHHVWATCRLIDVCLGLTDEQLQTPAAGTYGPIIETMRHIVGADTDYLHVMTDGEVAQIDEATMDLPALRDEMVRNEARWADAVARHPDPEAVVVRHRDDGSESHAQAGTRLHQAIHHGTDHRSQICTALTALGIEPPEIDVWAYADSKGTLAVVVAPAVAAPDA